MNTRTIRLALALTAFVVVLQWSPSAQADTFTGTVGVIRVYTGPQGQPAWIGFKFTDPNITQGCTYGAYVNNLANDYAVISGGTLTREIYAILLSSKKSGPITCTTQGAKANLNGCTISYCDLP